MRAVLLVLKGLGWLLLGLLLLLLAVLIVPVRVFVGYESGRVSARLWFMGVPISLYDTDKPKSVHRRKKKAAEEKEGTQPEKPEKKSGRKLNLQTIRSLLRPASGAAGFFLRRIRFYHVRLRLIAGGRDAAEVGINTGRIWEAVTALSLLVQQFWRPQVDELCVLPDFLGEYKGQERVSFYLKATPLSLLAAGILFLWRYLRSCAERRSAQRDEERF